jgi:hypothetical protein
MFKMRRLPVFAETAVSNVDFHTLLRDMFRSLRSTKCTIPPTKFWGGATIRLKGLKKTMKIAEIQTGNLPIVITSTEKILEGCDLFIVSDSRPTY